MVIGKDSSDGLRLARVYWIGLGRPPKFDSEKFMVNWSTRLETLMRKAGMAYDDFKWFIIWSTRLRDEDGGNYGNNYSAEFLRIAHDPMHSLEKNFQRMFFNIFMEEGYKKLPYLKDKHQREQEMLQYKQQLAHQNDPPPDWSWHEAYCGSMKTPPARKLEAARYFTALDARFPMLEPAPGEEMGDFVDRMFLPFSDNRDWKCSQCTYNPSRTGIRNAPKMVDGKEVEPDPMEEVVVYYGYEERLKWCADCYEDLLMNASEELESGWDAEATVSDMLTAWDYH